MKKFVLFFGLMGLLGCFSQLHHYTYPQKFEYVEAKEISTSMDKLAVSVAHLNRILTKSDSMQLEKQKEVVEIIKEMEKTSNEFKPGQQTNHPMIDQKLEAFRFNLENARNAAAATPPNYYLAGTITGSCSNCHGM